MSKIRLSLVFVTLSYLWGCGSPEEATINQFFLAAKSNDGATLAAMSAVSPPGPVDSWEVVEISSQSIVPFELSGLSGQKDEAEKIRDAQLEEGRNYLVNNREALDQIIPQLQEDSSFVFDGELGEIQQAWSVLVQDRKAKERKFQDLKRAIEQEIKLAGRSVMSQTEIEFLVGEVAITEVLMVLESPEAGPKMYSVTLRNYALSLPDADRAEPSRWIIVAIEEEAPT